MTILVTGTAGFIGFHLSKKLLELKKKVIGIDNLNSYYSKKLKHERLKLLKKTEQANDQSSFEFFEKDIEDKQEIDKIFKKYKPDIVINLAAQAGVRYSIENPTAYVHSNLFGFINILEGCRNYPVKNLIYASSSSVYGGNTNLPFSENQSVDHPISLYAATKKSNEVMAHTYSHLYEIPTTGLRFFTVYGPWGRPDMALFTFTKLILEDKPIKVFNNGEMIRDFTYIDDVVESLIRLIKKPATKNPSFNKLEPDPATSWAKYRIFNVGNSNPVSLMEYIFAIEKNLGKKAKKEFLPLQPGDVPITSCDNSRLEEWISFKPKTTIEEGVNKFVSWYKKFY